MQVNEKRFTILYSALISKRQEYDWAHKDVIGAIEDIDPNCNEHLDGEPMNELEILAAKNAIINSKMPQAEYKEPVKPVPVSSNTPVSDNSSTVETSQMKKTAILTQKKKRWPFSFLSKKPAVNNNTITNYETHKSAIVTNSNSSSIPPTPVLSPATSSSTASPSPPIHYQPSSQGSWAFRAPMVSYWVRFDPVNQQKISQHVHSNNAGILYLFDSHLCHGQLPVLALPFQRLCYYALDYYVSQVGCLQLEYVPNLPTHHT